MTSTKSETRLTDNSSPETLQTRLASVRLLILDVDGVLTDGGVFLGETEELKRFDVRDATGIKYLRRSGIEVALVSGHDSQSVVHFAKQLGITEVHQKSLQKWPIVHNILLRNKLKLEEVAFVGDDLVDLPIFLRVGVGIAVADAHEEALARADLVTKNPGGRGAVREVVEILLRAQGKWDEILAPYLQTQDQKSETP